MTSITVTSQTQQVVVQETAANVIEVITAGQTGPAGPTGPAGVGAAWQQGAGAPGSGVGDNGDFYLNTTNGDIYGPKAAGAWGSVVFNIAEGQQGPAGPTGPQGPQGVQGETGPQGTAGAAGATGPAGATGATGPAGVVAATAPITYDAGTQTVAITAATTSAAGSMSAADKTKLDGIAAGAEVNVNADWNASSGDAQILNKPTLGGAAALNVGTTAGTVAAGDDTRITGALSATTAASTYQPLDSDLTSIAELSTTTFGRSLLTQADAAATRTTIGAGTSNVAVSSSAAQALGATAGAGSSADAARADHVHQRDSDVIVVPVGDESTSLTTGTNKVRFRMPFAATLLAVRANVNTAPTGSTLIVDINEAGTSVLGTKLSIAATETSSTTAASVATITDSSLADDAVISIDIDQIGSTVAGAGLKVSLFVRRS